MTRSSLSERDVCSKFITPAVTGAGWDLVTQIREEVGFTRGRIIVRGKLVRRGKAKRAGYVLYHKPNLPIALIEVKDNKHSVGERIMQTYFTGVGIPHFTGRALAKLVFPLPPLAEQRRIVEKVDQLMGLCDQLEAALAEAETTRARLLEALLREALAPLPIAQAA